MRRLTEEEFDDLQAVLRSYCEDVGVSFKQFASDVGEDAYKVASTDGESYAIAGTRREEAKDVVKRFLTSPQNKGMPSFLTACLGTLRDQLTAKQPGDRERYMAFVTAFEESPDYRKADGVVTFLTECRNSLSSGRPKKSAPRSQNGDPVPNRRISNLYRLAAREFEAHDHDVNYMDSRIGDSRYVCIRRSSKEQDKYVIHGLRFAPHWNDPEVYYFSEKYYVQQAENKLVGRKSQGLCFVEGAYLSAFSRPNNNEAALTYLHIRIPVFTSVDDSSPTHQTTISQFDGMISTVNTAGNRFWAPCLGFAAADKSDKHGKLGIFTDQELLQSFNDEQQETLREWLDNDRFSTTAV